MVQNKIDYKAGDCIQNIHNGYMYEIIRERAINKSRYGYYIQPIDGQGTYQFVNIVNMRYYERLGPMARILYTKGNI